MSRITRSLSNKELQSDPHDPEYAREIRRRKKRNHKRPVKEAVKKSAPRRSLLEEDVATGVMPSGRKSLL